VSTNEDPGIITGVWHSVPETAEGVAAMTKTPPSGKLYPVDGWDDGDDFPIPI
jgi:hypothetical protein